MPEPPIVPRDEREVRQTTNSRITWFQVVALMSAIAVLGISIFRFWSPLGLIVAIVIVGGLLAWILPERQVAMLHLEPKDRIETANDTRRTVIQVSGGLVVLVGLYFSYQGLQSTSFSIRNAQEAQVTERFAKLSEQLGSDKIDVRLGAIYGLERIATDSRGDQWTIMQLLTAFVRRHSHFRGQATVAAGNPSERPDEDLEAILTVIGRRQVDPGDARMLDLRGVLLKGLDLGDLVVSGRSGAYFRNVHFEDAQLQRAHVPGTTFENVILENAHLEQSRLQGTKFVNACLAGAYLNSVRPGGRGADLRGASLRGVDLRGTHWENADLRGTDLRGARLAHAIGLTREQLKEAITDESTSLTDAIGGPATCP